MGRQISSEMTKEMTNSMLEYFKCISMTLFQALEILPLIFLTQWSMPHFVYHVLSISFGRILFKSIIYMCKCVHIIWKILLSPILSALQLSLDLMHAQSYILPLHFFIFFINVYPVSLCVSRLIIRVFKLTTI